jgi:predicted lipoprotein with Yx(FWY)xxD motif
MRTPLLALLAISSGLAGAVAAAEVSRHSMPYPSAVALSEPSPGKWSYKSFPALLPLYVFDREPAGKSTCDNVCTAVWPIIRAEPGDKPVGLWTIIKRDDGRLQWAFKNKPLYTYFEDYPNEARGAGKDRDWYLDERAAEYLMKAGVQLPSLPPNADLKKNREENAVAVLLEP